MIIDGPYLVFLATVNDGMKALAPLSLSVLNKSNDLGKVLDPH